jgi:UDP-N-acetylglucosamine 4,6-dehydratase/UDP-glucose 4-epimerase
MFKDKKILITGGTGSLGTALTKKLLATEVDTIRIFSRDEWKQVQMKSKFNDSRLRFFIGDIRDKERLSRATENVNIVIHAAALKHVPVAEYNPFEAVKTNVNGAQNIIESCLDNNVELVLAISTDKAVSPLNTYGATKLLMERLFVSANNYRGNHKIKFLCVRYGNVLGSRGSVVPLFIKQITDEENLTITDTSMTRFNITMDESIKLIFRAIENGQGGEIFIPKLKAYRLGDLKDALMEILKSDSKIKALPIRPGEKLHETLINIDEIKNTFESEHDYIIIDKLIQNSDTFNLKNLSVAKLNDGYSSDKSDILSKEEIKQILLNENLIPNQNN